MLLKVESSCYWDRIAHHIAPDWGRPTTSLAPDWGTYNASLAPDWRTRNTTFAPDWGTSQTSFALMKCNGKDMDSSLPWVTSDFFSIHFQRIKFKFTNFFLLRWKGIANDVLGVPQSGANDVFVVPQSGVNVVGLSNWFHQLDSGTVSIRVLQLVPLTTAKAKRFQSSSFKNINDIDINISSY